MWPDDSTALTIACISAGCSLVGISIVRALRAWRFHQRMKRIKRQVMAEIAPMAEARRRAHGKHVVHRWPPKGDAA